MNRALRMRISVIAILLILVVNACAVAETVMPPKAKVVNHWNLSNCSVVLNRKTGTLMVRDQMNGLYMLMAPDGTKLTSEPYIDMGWEKTMFTVQKENGVNKTGMIDGAGKLVVPMQYQTVDEISERWQIADVYIEGSIFNNEFKAPDGKYYKYGYSDVYFDGKLVGTVKEKVYASAYGAYLDLGGAKYDSSMTLSTYVRDGYGNAEYDITDHGTFHMFTGQQVGVPSCTLTDEDVRDNIVIVGKNIVDLQGNLYGVIEKEYDYVWNFRDGYAEVERDGKVGLIDLTGKEVIPCEYDTISGFGYFIGGYTPAAKDGKVSYLDEQGRTTYEFVDADEGLISYIQSPMVSMRNDDETYTVVSAAAGKLPQTFKTVNVTGEGCPMFSALLPNDQAGVFDLYGQEIIPANSSYKNVYCYNISDDGSVIVAQKSYSSDYVIYQMSDAYGRKPAEKPVKPAAQPAASPAQPAVQPLQLAALFAQTAADDQWNCGCGSVNSSKFCPECGAARPEELKCAGCGYVPPANTTPKFCSECGTAF